MRMHARFLLTLLPLLTLTVALPVEAGRDKTAAAQDAPTGRTRTLPPKATESDEGASSSTPRSPQEKVGDTGCSWACCKRSTKKALQAAQTVADVAAPLAVVVAAAAGRPDIAGHIATGKTILDGVNDGAQNDDLSAIVNAAGAGAAAVLRQEGHHAAAATTDRLTGDVAGIVAAAQSGGSPSDIIAAVGTTVTDGLSAGGLQGAADVTATVTSRLTTGADAPEQEISSSDVAIVVTSTVRSVPLAGGSAGEEEEIIETAAPAPVNAESQMRSGDDPTALQTTDSTAAALDQVGAKGASEMATQAALAIHTLLQESRMTAAQEAQNLMAIVATLAQSVGKSEVAQMLTQMIAASVQGGAEGSSAGAAE